MTQLIRFLQRLVRERAALVLLTFAALGVAATAAATRVQIDTSVESLLIANDPDRPRNRALKAEFSNDEAILVAFDLGHPFSADDLRKLGRISHDVTKIDGVEEVLDLTTIEDVRSDAEMLNVSPLVDLSRVDLDIEAIRARARGHRLYRDNLVSDELDVLVLMAILEPFGPAERAQRVHAATDAVLRVIEAAAPPWAAYSSGYPTGEYEAGRILRHDFSVLTATALVIMLAIVYLTTRTLIAVALVTLLVAWSELVTLAWFGASGVALSPVSSAVPTIIAATSATYGIYLLGLLARVSDRREPAVVVIELLARPVLLAALSTAAGFLSLRYIDVQVIGEAGTALAVGIGGATLCTLLLVPAVIQRFGLRPPSQVGHYRWSLWGLRLARRPLLVAVAGTLLVMATIPGVLQIRFETDILRQFRAGNRLRVGDDFIRKHLSGSFISNVIVRTESAGQILEPDILRFTESLIAFLEKSPIVGRTVSFLDYLHLMDEALRPERRPSAAPPTRRLAEQYMLLYEMAGDPDDYRHYINDDRSALNINVRMTGSSGEAVDLYRRIAVFAATAPAGVEVDVLGTATLFHRAMMGITYGMVKGLLVALALIVATMMLMLRSVTLGVLAAIPNAAPILVCGGVLGWLGIPLSMGTSLVGCVALGLAVDDTAHVLGHLRDRGTIDETYATVSRPLVLTTVALGAGFSVLLLSAFESVAVLGAGVAVTLLVALLCDLFLLPSLLVLVGYSLTARAPARGRGGVTVRVARPHDLDADPARQRIESSVDGIVPPPDPRTGRE